MRYGIFMGGVENGIDVLFSGPLNEILEFTL